MISSVLVFALLGSPTFYSNLSYTSLKTLKRRFEQTHSALVLELKHGGVVFAKVFSEFIFLKQD